MLNSAVWAAFQWKDKGSQDEEWTNETQEHDNRAGVQRFRGIQPRIQRPGGTAGT